MRGCPSAQVFKDYFKELEEESIRDNFVITYELMDEMMDFGYPQISESKILREYITQAPPTPTTPAGTCWSVSAALVILGRIRRQVADARLGSVLSRSPAPRRASVRRRPTSCRWRSCRWR